MQKGRQKLNTSLVDHSADAEYSSFSASTGYTAPKSTIMKTDIDMMF